MITTIIVLTLAVVFQIKMYELSEKAIWKAIENAEDRGVYILPEMTYGPERK